MLKENAIWFCEWIVKNMILQEDGKKIIHNELKKCHKMNEMDFLNEKNAESTILLWVIREKYEDKWGQKYK